MIESNSLIRASAGTGKTFALATRYIRLMMIDRVDPKTILALTFSRAAAQEIYAKILVRLCAAAHDATGAEREWANLMQDFRDGNVPDAAARIAAIEGAGIPHAAEDFRRILRGLVDTQHLGAIATLDSFILRIVKNFPKEMGFQNAVEVLDPADENAAVEEALRGVLARTDGDGEALAQAFVLAKGGEFSRTCLAAIGNILNKSGWRNFVMAHPACADWTVGSMCRALDVPLASECPDLSALPFNDLGRKNAVSREEGFVRFAKSYDGSVSPLAVTDGVKDLMVHFWSHPEATAYEYEYYRKPIAFDCGAEGAAAIRAAIRHMMNLYLKRQLEIVKAKIDLTKAVEGAYERMTRRAGRLTFNDFTKFSAENEFSERGIAIENVQFRFDSQFDHWALDEFQDTSELQWKCLRELVKTVADAGCAGESRSAMAVGDLKQSIYTWRGASARPFEQLAGWEAFDGCTRDLRESHRYGPHIADFVNRVFGRGNVARVGIIPSACYDAVDAWSEGWTDHISHEAEDYVKVVAAAKGADSDDGLLSALHAELKPLWERHEADGSEDTVGILVRSNDKGLKVAEYLRAKGLPIVWEGMSPVRDLPVIEAVLALLRLGDHPEDTYAWKTADALFPVRKLLLPDCSDAASASAAVSRLLTRQGLSRTLKDFCGTLREKGGLAPKGLACDRLRQLVEMGVAFEARKTGGSDVDAFVRFLAESQKREIAVSSDVIRVLTIHRSKGLGIDHVFVPLFEGERWSAAIDAPTVSTPLYDGGDWVLSHLEKGCEAFNAKTKTAYDKMRSDRLAESLRTYYVALTRSKKSLFVIMPDDSEPDDYHKGILMRDLVVHAVDRALPYEAGAMPSLKPKADGKDPKPARDIWKNAGMRTVVERVSPSGGAAKGGRAWLKADSLFDAEFGAAAEKGTERHAAYARIRWIDPALPKDDVEMRIAGSEWAEAFLCPGPEAVVWCERSYELYENGTWETGQFDRVVFAGTGEAQKATVYDFKTNVRKAGESDAAFAERMKNQYDGQMFAYRHALSRLTGLPESRIRSCLLLEATMRPLPLAC